MGNSNDNHTAIYPLQPQHQTSQTLQPHMPGAIAAGTQTEIQYLLAVDEKCFQDLLPVAFASVHTI